MARPPKKQTGPRFFSRLTAGLYREIKRWWGFLGKRFTLLPLGRSALQITRRGSRTSLADASNGANATARITWESERHLFCLVCISGTDLA